MNITLKSIATVFSERKNSDDDNWGSIISKIKLDESIPANALEGINNFSHLQIIYYFHRARHENEITWFRSPRNNPDWPKSGIFGQRNKHRPNWIGSTIVELLSFEDRVLSVKGLDAIDGTPVFDIKPVFKQFLPRSEIRQPKWVDELMKNYW